MPTSNRWAFHGVILLSSILCLCSLVFPGILSENRHRFMNLLWVIVGTMAATSKTHFKWANQQVADVNAGRVKHMKIRCSLGAGQLLIWRSEKKSDSLAKHFIIRSGRLRQNLKWHVINLVDTKFILWEASCINSRLIYWYSFVFLTEILRTLHATMSDTT
jgi:hypothetical protein